MRSPLITVLTVVLLGACGEEEPEVETVDLDWSTPAIDGSLPVLDDPIGEAESIELRDGFSWEETVELEETGPEGFPALHYGLVYLENRDQIRALEAMGIYYSWLPLFPEERARWEGQLGSFRFQGDGRGVFAFVVIPAAIYNLIRDAAIEGEAPFRALILRDPPVAAAQHPDGSLSYRYLVENGFRYGLPREPGEEEAGSTVGAVRAPLFGKIVRVIVSAAEGVVEGVREGINWVDRELISGDTDIMVRLYLHNTDPSFGGPNNHMRRAWGTDMGQTIWLRGVEVWAIQGLGLAKGDTDEWGYTEINVAKDRGTTICVAAENDAAEITDFITEMVICDFQGTGEVHRNVKGPTFFSVDITDTRFNALGQMTDSYDWLRRVAGYTPSKAWVLMGPLANAITGINGRAFAPCTSYFDVWTFGYENLWAFYGSRVGDIASDVFMEADIIIPDGLFSNSRGAATHEYGHYVMCDMIVENNALDFGEAWGRVFSQTISTGGDPGPDMQALYVAEGWADFFAWQVMGGVNYFQFQEGDPSLFGDIIFYCPPEDPICMDDNVGGPTQVVPDEVLGSPFDQKIALVTTVLHDAFDGQPTGGDVPRNGGAWYRESFDDLFDLPRGGRSSGDEEVHLRGSDLYRIIRNWSQEDIDLFQRPFFNGIANTIRRAGFDETQTCQLFALHATDGMCDSLVSRDDLDTGAVRPSQPLDLEGEMQREFNTGHWTWWDVSPYATGFAFEVLDEAGATVTSGTKEYRRNQEVFVRNLPFDANLTFRVFTTNGSTRSDAAEHRVTTFAERVPYALGSAGPGSATIRWSPVEATEYVVRMTTPAGAVREVARTTGREVTVRGLAGGAEYRFEVISLNRAGVPSDPSDSVLVVPDEPNIIYVSSRDGSDTHPEAGSSLAPFRTLSAALAVVESRGAQVLRLDAGVYSETTSLTIPAVELTIEGGYDGRAGWAYTGETTRISAPASAHLASSCSTASFNADLTRGTRSGIIVQSGADLRFVGLVIASSATGVGADCGSAIHATDSAITLDDIRLLTQGTVPSGGCRVGVQVVGSGSLSIFGSEITGASHGGTTSGPNADVAGLCASGVDVVSISDSTITGLRNDGLTVTHAARAAVGVATTGSRSVRISRSTLRPIVAAEGWTLGTGFVAALDATASGQVFVDNTVALTPSGGTLNHALDIGGPDSGSLESLLLYHVTAAAGESYAMETTVDTPFQGAPVSLRGTIQQLRLVNNVLVYAGGGQDEFDLVMTGIHKQRLEADPVLGSFRGNVYSVPFEHEMPLVAYELCALDSTREFGAIISAVDLNTPELHHCYPTGGPSPFVARANVGLPFLPSSSSPPPAESVVLALDEEGRVVGFSATGMILGSPPASVDGAGDRLTEEDPVADVLVDREGVMRVDRRFPGVGAWGP